MAFRLGDPSCPIFLAPDRCWLRFSLDAVGCIIFVHFGVGLICSGEKDLSKLRR